MADRPIARTPAGKAVTHCEIPGRCQDHEAEMYRKFHEVHCADPDPDHQCAGRVTVDRNGVTMSCPLCGDARKIYG